MPRIPILSRLTYGDYMSLTVALGILLTERLVRLCLYFLPYSLVDHLRFHFVGLVPRVFTGCQDEEIADIHRPMVQCRTAKEIVEESRDGEGRYRCEEYAVFTPDGYVLILHRLRLRDAETGPVCDETDGNVFGDGLFAVREETRRGNRVGPPVIFNHGAMMTSEAWLTTPTRTVAGSVPDDERGRIPATLPHVLLHAGYDVWLMNRRGNKYSCKHTQLSTHSAAFWSFSLDEPACRDLPVVIDFVLEETNYASVSVVGFSQGSAEVLAALSLVKGLNDKVNLAILLAPTTKPRVSGFRAAIIRTMVKLTPELIFLIFGRRVMLSFVPFWQRVLSPRFYVHLLDFFMRWIFGWHSANMLFEDKIVFYQHLFSYTSVKQIVHWFQIMRAGRFQMFDEGPTLQVAIGHLPPAYPLHQITTPIALFDGTLDTLQDESLRHLPAVVARYTVTGYEHLDFMWAESVGRKVWPLVLRLLNRLRVRNPVGKTADANSNPELMALLRELLASRQTEATLSLPAVAMALPSHQKDRPRSKHKAKVYGRKHFSPPESPPTSSSD